VWLFGNVLHVLQKVSTASAVAVKVIAATARTAELLAGGQPRGWRG
jgi:hypothetical protein